MYITVMGCGDTYIHCSSIHVSIRTCASVAIDGSFILFLRPAEVDCVSHRTKFITVTPTQKEPFYCSSRDVVSPKIRSQEGGGTVVYTNLPGPQKYV